MLIVCFSENGRKERKIEKEIKVKERNKQNLFWKFILKQKMTDDSIVMKFLLFIHESIKTN